MRFYKVIDGSYLLYIGTGDGNEEITETEYNEIMTVIQNKPTPPDGYDYRLKTDLSWEEYEIEPPEPYEPTDEDKAEGYDILIGSE